jgi:hypothetical protein
MSGLAARLVVLLFAAPLLAAQTSDVPVFDVASVKPHLSGEEGAAPSLPAALEEQAGVRLRRQRAPVDVRVVERLERPTPD